jgi:PAS domain S-box-containing protein
LSVSLRTKVLLPLAFFTVLQSAFVYLVWMPHSIENGENDYTRNAEHHLDSVIEGLIPLLLAHELDAIHENLHALYEKNTDWISVRLTNEQGRTLFPLILPLSAQPRRMTYDSHVIDRPIDYLGKSLGVLTVTIDFGQRLADIKQKYRELGTVLLIVTSFFVFVVATILDRVFITPVRAVSAAAEHLAQGDYSAPLEAESNDEVGQLVQRFSDMRDALHVHEAQMLERSRQVQRSREHLAEAQRIAHIGSWEFNSGTNELVWSEEVFRIFGMERSTDGVALTVFQDQVHTDDRTLVNDAYAGCLSDNLPFNIVHRIVRQSDNAIRHVQEKCEIIHDDQGIIRGARGTIHDITEIKLAEAAVVESENKLRSIANAAQDGILMLDPEGRISYWNPAAEKMFQFTAEEAMGKELHRLLAPSHLSEVFIGGFSRFTKTGEGPLVNRTLETTARRKNGAEFPIEVSVSAFKENGRWNAVGIVRDITDRSKLEAQLRQSQKMEAVGQLAGGIAHDFNNLLSAIMGYGQIVNKKMAADDPLKLYVGYLLESADRAAYLTRSLLAFSRKQIINPTIVDANEVIGKIDKFLRRIIGEDVELKTVFRQHALFVNADRSQIEQVLMNLATNARDAMPRGGHLILETDIMTIDDAYIRAHGYGESGKYAVLSVTDSGEGMDKETQKKIFEPFFTTKEVGKGTGLGLSMAYGIIKQHHGFISVYSELGTGTVFRIYLPLVKEERGENGAAASEDAGMQRGSETILLAEDDEGVRRLSRIALTEAGYRVIEAVDGADAIARYESGTAEIDLVILDVIMPKKSGKEVLDAIRSSRSDMKAIYVSGYTADKISAEGVRSDDVPLLLKPLSPSQLLTMVRNVLDGRVAPPL